MRLQCWGGRRKRPLAFTEHGTITAATIPDSPRASSRYPVDYLYSLYDALVSIHVPNDKARAVVDAMERDMATTIATKADLQILRSELHQECTLIRKDMEIMATTITTNVIVRTGSMLVVAIGLLFAALKLT
jgi:hypothetical protein